MQIFSANTPARVHVHPSENGCIHLAVKDLLLDLTRVSGMAHSCHALEGAAEGALIIGTLTNPAFAAHLAGQGVDASQIAGKWENYMLLTHGGNLYIVGSDERGTMWGVYTFCEQQLHIDPLYLWTDHEPRHMNSLSVDSLCVVDGPKTYRFRGWFINDEDLLEGFCCQERPQKGYDFHPDYAPALSMIMETMLRMKQNLIIPCSHLDIDKPEEEELVRMICERGLYISMHHQEPVGVHQKTIDRYFKDTGIENVNFVDHPQLYHQIWRHYISKWAKYPNVIWQLGLRGRGDRPVWFENDRVPATVEARGALISGAIQKQKDIIAEETGTTDFLSSSTLWMEGMPLYKAGALTFPKDTMIIMSDFGPDQMFGEEFYQAPRLEGMDYGVYYHVCFWGCGPHLVQGNRPEKILYNYRNAVETGDSCYSILNVSNIRESLCGIAYTAQVTWDIDNANPDAFMRSWCEKQYHVQSGEAAAALYRDYYECFAKMDDSRIEGRMLFMDGMSKRVALKLMQIICGQELQQVDIQNKRLFNFPDTDSFIAYYQNASAKGAERFEKLIERENAMLPQIADARKSFFTANLLVQTEIIAGMYRWVHALTLAAQNRRTGGDDDAYTQYINAAAAALERILEVRKQAEYGRFSRWYDGDTLIDTIDILHKTKGLHLGAEQEQATHDILGSRF